MWQQTAGRAGAASVNQRENKLDVARGLKLSVYLRDILLSAGPHLLIIPQIAAPAGDYVQPSERPRDILIQTTILPLP